jgi:cytochrome oxidase Cu insertion factor (SCO1/SenC/PrrC family)
MRVTKRIVPALAALALLSFPSLLSAQSSRFEEFTMTNPMVGDMAPDFTLQTVDGEELTLSEAYADRPVVIEFGSYT